MPLECHWVTHWTQGYHRTTQRILAGYTGTPMEKLIWICPTLECHWRNSWLLQPTLEHHWRDYNSTHTHRHIYFSRVAFMSVCNDKMTEHQAAGGHISVNPACTWSLLFSNAYQLSANVLSASLCACLGHEHHYSAEVTRPNEIQTRHSQYSRDTSSIHGLQTRFRHCMGKPLDRLHWNHTGLWYRPVVSKWQSSVNLHNWTILKGHWSHKYTAMPLEPHWLMLAPSGIQVAIQC